MKINEKLSSFLVKYLKVVGVLLPLVSVSAGNCRVLERLFPQRAS